jgi:FMNH2-dependent dimethyl sulfone monooxygenase
MTFGLAVYAITRNTQQEALAEVRRITDVNQSNLGYENYQQWLSGTQLERRVSLEDYSVSNRGLQAGLVGSHQQVQDRIGEFQAAGVDLLLLQCSPQIEEMERFSECVIRHFGQKSPVG